jgi:hypothetical protein
MSDFETTGRMYAPVACIDDGVGLLKAQLNTTALRVILLLYTTTVHYVPIKAATISFALVGVI